MRKEHGIASKRLHMTGRDVYLSVTIFPSGLKIHCVYSCLGRQQWHAHSQVGLPVDCSSTLHSSASLSTQRGSGARGYPTRCEERTTASFTSHRPAERVRRALAMAATPMQQALTALQAELAHSQAQVLQLTQKVDQLTAAHNHLHSESDRLFKERHNEITALEAKLQSTLFRQQFDLLDLKSMKPEK